MKKMIYCSCDLVIITGIKFLKHHLLLMANLTKVVNYITYHIWHIPVQIVEPVNLGVLTWKTEQCITV